MGGSLAETPCELTEKSLLGLPFWGRHAHSAVVARIRRAADVVDH